MGYTRRALLQGAIGGSVAGAAFAAVPAFGESPEATAALSNGVVSYAWFWSPKARQSIPSGGWHDLSWPTAVCDNDRYHSSAHPTRIHFVQGGLYNVVAEVAWPARAAGYRGLRIVQADFVIAEAPFLKGATAAELPEPHQHQQVAAQPGGRPYATIQVCQNSGSPLTCGVDNIAAPSMMVVRLGPIA
jgi:hypothetical protein